MSEKSGPRGSEKSLMEIFATGDWSDENICLRTIVQLANRKKLTEFGEDMSVEQAWEIMSKSAIDGARRIDVSEVNPETRLGHGLLYCSVPNCHFSAEYIALEMPGEVGVTYNFPTPEKLDEGEFPCKIKDRTGLEPK